MSFDIAHLQYNRCVSECVYCHLIARLLVVNMYCISLLLWHVSANNNGYDLLVCTIYQIQLMTMFQHQTHQTLGFVSDLILIYLFMYHPFAMCVTLGQINERIR
jgi:hypothetical protein